MLEEKCDDTRGESAVFAAEHRREVFHWAAARVKALVEETTWQAFWKSSVESMPIAEVARVLGISVGNVYVARSRVMAKLRSEVSRFEDRSAVG